MQSPCCHVFVRNANLSLSFSLSLCLCLLQVVTPLIIIDFYAFIVAVVVDVPLSIHSFCITIVRTLHLHIPLASLSAACPSLISIFFDFNHPSKVDQASTNSIITATRTRKLLQCLLLFDTSTDHKHGVHIKHIKSCHRAIALTHSRLPLPRYARSSERMNERCVSWMPQTMNGYLYFVGYVREGGDSARRVPSGATSFLRRWCSHKTVTPYHDGTRRLTANHRDLERQRGVRRNIRGRTSRTIRCNSEPRRGD